MTYKWSDFTIKDVMVDLNNILEVSYETLPLIEFLMRLLKLKSFGPSDGAGDIQLTSFAPWNCEGVNGYFIDQHKATVNTLATGEYYGWATTKGSLTCSSGAVTGTGLVAATTGYRIQVGFVLLSEDGDGTIDYGEPKEVMTLIIQDNTGTPVELARVRVMAGQPAFFWCGGMTGTGKELQLDCSGGNGAGTEEIDYVISWRKISL